MRIFLLAGLLAVIGPARGFTTCNSLPRPAPHPAAARAPASAIAMKLVPDRKEALRVGLGFAAAAALGGGASKADAAVGRDVFTSPLHNRYFLVRSGETAWETEGTSLTTNPVHKLHQLRNGLSQEGWDQAKKAADGLRAGGFGAETECWVWTSTHASCYQTAEILADEFLIPYSHIVPEFSFLDQRGYGLLEGSPVAEARKAVWASDAKDPAWRMPANTDGTPNESLRDVQVRVKQALQIMETQYSDLDIAIVGPDTETLSALHCSLEGAPLHLAHQFSFGPGDVRLMDYRHRQEAENRAFADLGGPTPEATHEVLRVNNILFKDGPEHFVGHGPRL